MLDRRWCSNAVKLFVCASALLSRAAVDMGLDKAALVRRISLPNRAHERCSKAELGGSIPSEVARACRVRLCPKLCPRAAINGFSAAIQQPKRVDTTKKKPLWIKGFSPVSSLRRPLLYPLSYWRSSAARPRSRSICEIGVRGFEPPTPCAQGRCATRLRYTPPISVVCFRRPRRVTQTPPAQPTETARLGNRARPGNQSSLQLAQAAACADRKLSRFRRSHVQAWARWLTRFFTAAGISANAESKGG